MTALARPLALIGFMGSGKSVAGSRLAKRLDRQFLDLDEVIAAAAGMPVADILRRLGETPFRRMELEHLPDVLLPGAVAALGGGTPARDASWDYVGRHARTVWLDAPLEECWRRVGGDPGRPLAAERGRFELLYQARRDRYAEADDRVDAGQPLEAVVEDLARLCAPSR